MTKKDESPEEATNPYWSDELLAVLAEALGDEDRARQTLEGIIQQAQEGKAMRTLSTERLASHLTELYGRIAEGVRNSGVKKRRSLDTKSGVVVQAATAAIDKAHSELLEELLEERVAMAEELAERKLCALLSSISNAYVQKKQAAQLAVQKHTNQHGGNTIDSGRQARDPLA